MQTPSLARCRCVGALVQCSIDAVCAFYSISPSPCVFARRMCVYTKHTARVRSYTTRLLISHELDCVPLIQSYMQWWSVHLVLRFRTKIQCNKPNRAIRIKWIVLHSIVFKNQCFAWHIVAADCKNKQFYNTKMERSNWASSQINDRREKTVYCVVTFFYQFYCFLSSLYFSLFCCLFRCCFFSFYYFVLCVYLFLWGITSYCSRVLVFFLLSFALLFHCLFFFLLSFHFTYRLLESFWHGLPDLWQRDQSAIVIFRGNAIFNRENDCLRTFQIGMFYHFHRLLLLLVFSSLFVIRFLFICFVCLPSYSFSGSTL